MKPSIRASTKKRGRPPTTGKGEQIGVRLHAPLLPALDAWIEDQPDPRPTRAEAMRIALADWLKAKGHL
jgi:hypothetical protein